MKIERKLTLNCSNELFHYYLCEEFKFCASEFRRYAPVGKRKVIFLIVSDRRPRHKEAFKLVQEQRRYTWMLANNFDKIYAWNDSPWMGGFDRFLTKKFKNTKTVYAWIEYE